MRWFRKEKNGKKIGEGMNKVKGGGSNGQKNREGGVMAK